eukprot:TRINITY_DN3274_c0_g1_i18.p1 TRINITY_DN3274_c0_g1~~TRINITY_DN3274_c0_g1_i18.p1  ORF type:complete len:271 (-),score=30.78 TRINITY_DN3274_c0_g1_i18:148-960(-)
MCIRDSYYTESFNEGREWMEPVKVMDDEKERTNPRLFFEKDTEKFYVTYDTSAGIGLAVRDPKTFNFTEQIIFPNRRSGCAKYLNFKASFHLFANLKIHSSESGLEHFKSFDSAKSWTYSNTTASGFTNMHRIPVAAGNEGHFYVQYHKKPVNNRIEIVWTKDYGETWERPIVMKNTMEDSDAIAMCGEGSNECVFSFHGKTRYSNGYMKYVKSGQTDFKELSHPFPRFGRIQDTDMRCVYKDGKYTLALGLIDFSSHRVYAAYGTASDL